MVYNLGFVTLWCLFMTPLELTLSKIRENIQRASRVLRTPVYTHSFSKGEKRGTQYQYKMDSVLRNYFAGGRIRKTETNVFEIRRGLGFRPAGECGRNAGRGFWLLEKIQIW